MTNRAEMERVARVIFTMIAAQIGKASSYEALPEAPKEKVREVALAAIEAMTSTGGVTPDQIYAGLGADALNDGKPPHERIEAIYLAMRDDSPSAEAKGLLFTAIAHGDEEHRAWLKEAVDAHFDGLPVPAPRGSGNKEAKIAEQAKVIEGLRGAIRSFELADTEFRRAKNAGEQPRLSKAGTRYQCAKWRLFAALANQAEKS